MTKIHVCSMHVSITVGATIGVGHWGEYYALLQHSCLQPYYYISRLGPEELA